MGTVLSPKSGLEASETRLEIWTTPVAGAERPAAEGGVEGQVDGGAACGGVGLPGEINPDLEVSSANGRNGYVHNVDSIRGIGIDGADVAGNGRHFRIHQEAESGG